MAARSRFDPTPDEFFRLATESPFTVDELRVIYASYKLRATRIAGVPHMNTFESVRTRIISHRLELAYTLMIDESFEELQEAERDARVDERRSARASIESWLATLQHERTPGSLRRYARHATKDDIDSIFSGVDADELDLDTFIARAADTSTT